MLGPCMVFTRIDLFYFFKWKYSRLFFQKNRDFSSQQVALLQLHPPPGPPHTLASPEPLDPRDDARACGESGSA